MAKNVQLDTHMTLVFDHDSRYSPELEYRF